MISTESDLQMSRPNFFPGQGIDYRDFNRLAKQAERIQSFLVSQLYPEGGIFLHEKSGLKISTHEGLKVSILPGSALLPSGQLLNWNRETLVDLSHYLPSDGSSWLVLSLSNQTKGLDPFEDPTDPSVHGYTTEALEPLLSVSKDECPSHSIEIFRIYLTPKTSLVRFPPDKMTWDSTGKPLGKNLSDDHGNVAYLDLRFRKPIFSLNYSPIPLDQLLNLRKALHETETALVRLKDMFLPKEDYGIEGVLVQLHGSLLETPLQAMKVDFLIAEAADRIARFLETLLRCVPRYRPELNRKKVMKILKDSISLRKKVTFHPEVSTRSPISELHKFLCEFSSLSKEAHSKLDFENTIQAAISDQQDRAFSFDQQEVIAGFCFRRVDWITAEDTNYTVYSEESIPRKQTARYLDGKKVTTTGIFIPKGKLTIPFNIPDPRQPAILFFRYYERRQKGKVRYLINGKTLQIVKSTKGTFSHRWKNLGWLIPMDQLTVESNHFSIHIEESDLDFGFFNLAIYQQSKAASSPEGDFSCE